MAAGLTLCQLEEMVDDSFPIIRIMPNTPVSEGAGVILYVQNQAVSNEQLSLFTSIMAGAGNLYPLDETLMDAGSAVSGCGPAFAYLFIDALADGGVACGLSRTDAQNFAAQTVLGAALMVLSTGKHPEELKNNVCSPGGSTIQGVRTLEQRALRATCMDAVISAFEKTKELGKES
jgi:pyrroline-5-carboxylate reductase